MARKNGKAEALEDWLFANQPTLTLDGLKRAVRDIGGVADFDAQYPKVIGDVKTDTSLGGFLGVRSTPTFFVNGIQMPDAGWKSWTWPSSTSCEKPASASKVVAAVSRFSFGHACYRNA